MSRYYDPDGNPITFEDWSTPGRGIHSIAEDTHGEVRVSTVYLGLNHNFDDSGPPLIFETMVFGGQEDELQWRYSTKEQALLGHNAALEHVKNNDFDFQKELA